MPVEIGYFDMEVPGALPVGARVRKVRSEEGDRNPTGTEGTVAGSIEDPSDKQLAYFIVWDTMPGVPVATMGWKVEAVNPKPIGDVDEDAFNAGWGGS